MDELDQKLRALEGSLESMKKVAVAFSAGVDSTLLLAMSKRVLGENVLALTVSTELQPPHEIEMAKEIAQRLGVRLLIIRLQLLNNPEIGRNPKDRCYLCKRSVLAAILRSAKEKGFPIVADGTNADDARSTRPGLKALTELGVRSPLAEAEMTKEDVRAASARLDLPTKDKPSNPCLATRIPYDSALTVEKLNMVAEAEAGLRELGFADSRVRHHGAIARIEVPVARFKDIIVERERIVQIVKQAGFVYAALDLQGYRSGSLEEEIQMRPLSDE
ncbi:MAG: ATP-dependent sacrificial sulfur transferase LarE [Methanomassiliicoccales archaeon]|nr:ATP-dependent sacrificial sulfur transferase LarE [Methanomassiliicoccales archaeon]